jgi:glucose 1-dehydrogenase
MDDSHLPPTTAPSRPIQKVLVGQTAIVTGANSGIGRGVAIALGQAGANVVVNYVSGDNEAQDVVKTIEQSGVQSIAI